MGTVEENLALWRAYNWSNKGDEWSKAWGGTDYLWAGTIFPRLRAFLPADHILEIAPGYGRCTQYLVPLCRRLTLVDLVEDCIAYCRERFKVSRHIQYFVNDGRSLAMIEDNSINFAFSWDSLVHADSDVLLSYLKHLAAKLKPGGFGFIHHSNIGAYIDPATQKISIENPHWRARSMTAELFRQYCAVAGLKCVSQELIQWASPGFTDCFSVLTRPNTESSGDTVVFENPHFMAEADNLRRLAEVYHLHLPRPKSDRISSSDSTRPQPLVGRYDDESLDELRTQVHDLQRQARHFSLLINAVRKSRTYRLLRRLGRWGWFEQAAERFDRIVN